MARLQSTETFNTGDVLTASALTNHVVNAVPLPDFISLQTGLNTPDSLDEFLVTDVSVPACKKVTLANIAGNMPDTTVASLTVTTNATVTGNATVNGNTTIGSDNADTLTVNATPSFGAAATFNGYVTANANVILGSDNTDTVTLNGTLAGTIQGTPTVSLTSVSDAYGDKVLIQDASDSNRLKVVAACLPKAWACISTKTADTTTVAATVSRTNGSTTATVTKSSHGLKVGDVIYLDNGVADGWYDIKAVPDANTFNVQTVATTALSSVATQWYALTVNGFGISSAFKKDAADHVAMFNLATPMADVNYAIIATFSRDDGVAYGATCCNVIGFSNFDKTTKQFSITSNYASNPENGGSVMLSVFGNI